jgi:hypothetical protein
VNTTPKAITPEILELCKKLDDTQTPVFVPVRPVAGAIVDECYHNVRGHVEKRGGSIQHGWIIWEHPEVIIEGTFHACWKDLSGQFVDITPKRDRETEILFLPDSTRVYKNEPVDNVRLILTKNPTLVAQFKRQERLNQLRAKHNYGGQIASIPTNELAEALSGASTAEIIKLVGMETYQSLVADGDLRRPSKVGRNNPCPCRSGIKYKKCCGK